MYALEIHLERASRRPISVVLREMQNQAIARNLHVKRGIVIEAMLPVEMKSQIVEVKLARLFDGEDAQDRYHSAGALNHKIYRSNSSRVVLRSVFSSRYLTMTGAYKVSPHSWPRPFETARDPGTTTAFAGMMSGWVALARRIVPLIKSNTGVPRVRIVPAASTAPLRTIVPS